MKRTECRYCDSSMPPRSIDEDLVCGGCGAEWAAARIQRNISEKELEEEQQEIEEIERYLESVGYWD